MLAALPRLCLLSLVTTVLTIAGIPVPAGAGMTDGLVEAVAYPVSCNHDPPVHYCGEDSAGGCINQFGAIAYALSFIESQPEDTPGEGEDPTLVAKICAHGTISSYLTPVPGPFSFASEKECEEAEGPKPGANYRCGIVDYEGTGHVFRDTAVSRYGTDADEDEWDPQAISTGNPASFVFHHAHWHRADETHTHTSTTSTEADSAAELWFVSKYVDATVENFLVVP